MQIQTLFHSSKFLAKAHLKTGRKIVCVLLMLLVCAGAAWGEQYRWKTDSSSSSDGKKWDVADNWEKGIIWTGSGVPGTGDTIYIRGDVNKETVIFLSESVSLGSGTEFVLNSDRDNNTTIRFVAESSAVTITVDSLYFALNNGGSTKIILDNVTLVCSTLEVNNDLTGGTHRVDGNISISGTGTCGIQAGTVNVYNDHGGSTSNSTTINFGNVPLSATSINIATDDSKQNPMVIKTDSSITAETVTVGGANPKISGLTFDGTGSLDVINWGGNSASVPITMGSNLATWTYEVTVGSFAGFCSDGSHNSVPVSVSATKSLALTNADTSTGVSFTYTLEEIGTSGIFAFNHGTNLILWDHEGHTFSLDTTIAVYDTQSLDADDGFVLKIYSPGGNLIKTVSWTYGNPAWTGAVSTSWSDIGNWNGAGSLDALADKDITISSTVPKFPAISDDAAVKTLTVETGASVTQSDGEFTTESITCQGTGKVMASGGSVMFNGDAGTLTLSDDSYLFDAAIDTGKTLTLASPLYLKGSLDVSAGTLETAGNAVVFKGAGTAASPQTLGLGSNTLDALVINSGYVKLSADLEVSSLTVAAGATLDCSGYSLTITDDSAISGTVIADTFIATGMGGKTLTVDGTLQVGATGSSAIDTLVLEGSSTASRLTVVGSGTIKLNMSQPGGKWVDVTSGSVPVVRNLSGGATITFSAAYSIGPATDPSGWKIFSGASTYIWTGAANSTTWNDVANWSESEIPGDSSSVQISVAASGKYPVTPSTQLSLLSLTVDSSASITLGGTLICSGPLENEGTVLLDGSSQSVLLSATRFTGDGDYSVKGTATLRSVGANAALVGTVASVTTAGDATFTKTGDYTLTELSVSSGDTLTLGANLTVSTVTNNGTIVLGGKTLTFGAWDGAASGDENLVIQDGSGSLALASGGAGGTINCVEYTASRTFQEVDDAVSFNSLIVDSGKTVTLGNTYTFAGTVTNNGTVSLNGSSTAKTLTAASYAGTGGYSVRGTVTLKSTGATAGTVASVTTAGNTTFTQTGTYTLTQLTVSSGYTLTPGANLTADTVTNNGTIDLAGKTLTFGAWQGTTTGTTANLVKMNAAASLVLASGGAGGTINNVQFTASRTFSSIADNVIINNATVPSGVVLTAGSSLSFAGTFTNNGSVTIDGSSTAKTLTAASYAGSAGYSVKGDVTLASTGATAGTVASVTTADDTTFTQTGTYTLTQLTVSSGYTLTPGANLTAGTVTNNGTIDLAGKTLTFGTWQGTTTGTTANLVKMNAAASLVLASGGAGGTINNVQFTASRTFSSIANNVTITNGTVNSGVTLTAGSSLSFAGTFTNNGSVTIDGSSAAKTLTAATYAGTGGYSVKGGVTLASTGTNAGTVASVTTAGDAAFTQSGNYVLSAFTVTAGDTLTLNANLTVSGTGTAGKITNNGKIISSGKNISCTTYAHAGNTDILQLSGDVSLTAGSGTISTINYSCTANSTLRSGSGTVNCGMLKVTATSGTATLRGNISADTIKISAGNVTVRNGANITAGIFEATGLGGKTLTVNGTLTVGSGSTTNTLRLSGSSAASKLTISGSGTIKLNVTQINGTNARYLNLSSETGPVIQQQSGTTPVVYTAIYSTGQATIPQGWNLCEGELSFNWKGGTSGYETAWNTAANWATYLVPDSSDDVFIGTADNYPVTPSSATTVKSLKLNATTSSVTLAAALTVTNAVSNAGTIDTANYTLSYGSYSGNGTVRFGASGSVSGAATIRNAEFTATRTFGAIENVSLTNVKVNSGVTLTQSSALSFSGKLTNAGTIVTAGNNLSFDTLTDSGTIKLAAGGNLSAGTATQTVNNLVFTATRTAAFSGFTNISINNAEIASGVTLNLGAALTINGTLTNSGTINAGARNISAKKYTGLASYADKIIFTSGSISLTQTTSTVGTIDFTATRNLSSFTRVNFRNINISSGKEITLDTAITYAGTLTNGGTVKSSGKDISGGTFAGSGSIEIQDAVTISGAGIIPVLTVTGDTTLSTSGSASYTNVNVNPGKTLTLNNSFTLTGVLTNNGTVDMKNFSLTCGSYTDTTENGLIKLGTGTLSPGAGGVLKNIEFTASRNFSNITNLTIKNAKVDAARQISLNGNFTLTGAVDNNGIISCSNRQFTFASYTHSETASDELRTSGSGGSIICTGSGGSVSKAALNGAAAVTYQGTGTLTFATVTVSETSTNSLTVTNAGTGALELTDTSFTAAATLTTAMSGSATNLPALPKVTVANGKTLTLGSNLTIGELVNSGTVNVLGYTLSFAKYANPETAKIDAVLANGGTVISTGAGTGSTDAIASATLNGAVTVRKTGMGALTLQSVSVTAASSSLSVMNASSGTLKLADTSFTENATLTTAISGSATNQPELTKVTVANGKMLTMGSNLTIGELSNKGTVSVGNKSLTFNAYTHPGVTGDTLVLAGGSVSSADTGGTVSKVTVSDSSDIGKTGTGVFTIAEVALGTANASLTVTNSNNGLLTITDTNVTQDATLKTQQTESYPLPVLSTVTVTGCKLTGDATAGFTAGTLNVATGGSSELAGKMTATTAVFNAATTVSGMVTATSSAEMKADLTINAGATLSAVYFAANNLGGKALTVNGTLVAGTGNATRDTLRLSGSGAASLLNVAGSGTIKLNLSQVGGDYLAVSSSGPRVTQLDGGSDIVLTTIHSPVPATIPAGWNFCAGNLVFVWKGGYSGNPTEWSEEHNWMVHIVPNALYPVSNVTDVVVEIPAAANNPRTSVPVRVKDLSMVSTMTLTVNDVFTVTNNLTNSGTILENADVTVDNILTNTGTINMNGQSLTFRTYADNDGTGLLMIGAEGNIVPTGSSANVGTINSIRFMGSRSFANISKLIFKNGEIRSSGETGMTLTFADDIRFTGNLINYETVVLNGDLTVDHALTNNGTINMNGKNLKFASYNDTSTGSKGLVKLGATGTLIPTGTAPCGTINNIEFTGTRSFADIAGLTFRNGTVDAAKALTLSGNLSFTDALTNKGTVHIGTHALTFASYNHAGVSDDALTVAGGSITSTGSGTAGNGITALTMNGNATVSNNGTGALKIAATNVNANAQLTSGGTGQSPMFTSLSITGSNQLTLASNLTAGTITIAANARLDADSRGTVSAPETGNKLYVYGDFINNNFTLAETDDIVYRGFIPRSSEFIFTGSGSTHRMHGNNTFYDFTCHEPGATIIFDVGTTTNVDHQIDLEGSEGHLITLTTESTVEGEKWTLDVIWDVAEGTPQHPKPKIKYVAPHKSISYSAILKGCLDHCVDDVSELLDSTNVNWFNDMPTILMTLAPVGGRQLFVLFSTEVTAAHGCDLRTAIKLKGAASDASLIDTTSALTTYKGHSDKSKTAVVFTLTRDITWNDLYGNDCLHLEVVQSNAVRVGTTRIAYQSGVKHCASDLAVNAARMLFGFDNFIDSSTPLTIEKGTNSVRTWDQSDPISNRLHSDSDLLFQAQFDASVPEGIKLEMIALLASQLNESVISDNYSDYYDLSTRLWLPESFKPLSTGDQNVPSGQKIAQDSTSSGRLRNFSLHYNSTAADQLFRMEDGSEIQFLFKVKNPDGTDLMIDHDYDEDNGIYTPTPERPVYAIRLVDDADVTSFDLWSLVLQDTTMQRGNVTILNNVINSDQKEQTFVTIQLQKAGSLTVQVLTLDGAVVTTLQRGRKQAGTWGYSWDGTNGKGKPVARGMYFIRVIGPDIDETRKVMVVRD